MNIIGLSAFYHESACCLLQDGQLIAAAAEERFTRIKHDPRLPVNAFRFCLEAGGLTIADVDYLAYYENPAKKQKRQRWSGLPRSETEALLMDSARPEQLIRDYLGYDEPIFTFDHHLSHGASAFFYSGFAAAAVLTVDGVGEWTTTSYAYGQGSNLEIFEEVRFPHSLGLLYATLTAYLGFRVNSGEYKVMGLAAYGRPLYVERIHRLVQTGPAGQFNLDMTYFDFVTGDKMYSQKLVDLFQHGPRPPDSAIEPFHQDVAHSLQLVLEEILLEKVNYLASRVDSPNLCLAGGVALNSVANGRIHREGPFSNLFVQPAAGDAGGCLGAAALAHIQITGQRHTTQPMRHVYLGPAARTDELQLLFQTIGIEPHDFRHNDANLYDEIVRRLLAGQIIGWFQGRMEFGPRALGARSILANPMDSTVRDRLNRHIKQREDFRPFAPSVLAEHAAAHFDLPQLSPFMLETCQVTSPLDLPAITHVDGSARPQTVTADNNPRYARLLRAFYEQTGCPLLLNTSFNVRGEPIVCTAVDALICLARAGLDALVLEDYLIDRAMLPQNWENVLPLLTTKPRFAFRTSQNAIAETLYTFV